MAVENIAGRTFDDFLQTAIFEPLGMNDTRPERGPRTAEEAKGYGGLVSRADDLLKWDQGLAIDKLVHAQTLMEGLVPPK
jgi:CubicO group peptidase (beta-lactamase class C family)